jgi:hypothetical protein
MGNETHGPQAEFSDRQQNGSLIATVLPALSMSKISQQAFEHALSSLTKRCIKLNAAQQNATKSWRNCRAR